MSVEAFTYACREVQGFFGHLAGALEGHLQGQELPPSLFAEHPAAPERKARKPKGDKPKRQPTAYNRFMAVAIEQLKAEGFTSDDPRGIFKAAVERWKALSEEEKAKFIADCAKEDAAAEDAQDEDEAVEDPQAASPSQAKQAAAATPRAATSGPAKPAASSGVPKAAAATTAAATTPAAGTEAAEEKKKKKKKRDKEKREDGHDGEKRKKKKKRDKEKPADGQSNE